jgi:hypothetical protein
VEKGKFEIRRQYYWWGDWEAAFPAEEDSLSASSCTCKEEEKDVGQIWPELRERTGKEKRKRRTCFDRKAS